jgi:methionyl aminopeptidase
MDDNIYEKYKQAGKIAAKARDYGISLIKPGKRFLEVAELIEKKILQSGAELAFPVNIAVNEIAAHYTPSHNDNKIFYKGDIVKIDVGAHIDGFIADTAATLEVETDNYSDMIRAVGEGLDTAINMIKSGIDLSNIGKAVKKSISSFGYKPIDNLTGHNLNRFILHGGLSVPSVPELIKKRRPKEDDVIAIEPFATNGIGHVISGFGSNIFLCNKNINLRLLRDKKSRIFFNRLKNNYKTLPFAERWAFKLFDNDDIFLRKLNFLGVIKHYPQLIEAKNGIVAQKEHTVIINQEGCEVTT